MEVLSFSLNKLKHESWGFMKPYTLACIQLSICKKSVNTGAFEKEIAGTTI